jgi:hypothetical protein
MSNVDSPLDRLLNRSDPEAVQEQFQQAFQQLQEAFQQEHEQLLLLLQQRSQDFELTIPQLVLRVYRHVDYVWCRNWRH